jgi:hypothetical protein
MKTTLKIDRDGTAHIPLISDSGYEIGVCTFPANMGGFETFAEKNRLQMGEILSEDTMEITLEVTRRPILTPIEFR